MKKTPTGFVAVCQCGETVGAVDAQFVDRRCVGRWLREGCTVTPRFNMGWRVDVTPCKCER